MTSMLLGKVNVNQEERKKEASQACFEPVFDKVYADRGGMLESEIRERTILFSSPDALDKALSANPNVLRQTIRDIAYQLVFGPEFPDKPRAEAAMMVVQKLGSQYMSSVVWETLDWKLKLLVYGRLFEGLFGVPVADTICDRVYRIHIPGGAMYGLACYAFESVLWNLLDSVRYTHEEAVESPLRSPLRIRFPRPFARKPQVALGISGLKQSGGAFDVELAAIQVTNEGFSLAGVPYPSALTSITVSWFAAEIEVSRPEKITASASSFQPCDGPENAIDGANESLWHTPWDLSAALPQWIQLDFGAEYTLAGLLYTPRQSGGPNGIILAWSIEVSSDGENFREVARGDWPEDRAQKQVTFDETSARYVRLLAHAGVGGYASASEVAPLFAGEV